MKAIICSQYGMPSALKYKEVIDPTPRKGELLIAVKACSVNFPDTLIIQGLYQIQPKLPFSPGSDIAGVVEALGEGVTHFKVGDEIVGFNPYGGFAEKVVAKAENCFPKPRGMSMVNASAFLMAYGTSYHALKDRGQIKAGDTVLILGAAGGVGIAAVELSKLMGAKVIAAASTNEKLELCKYFGADEVINYATENLKERTKELTNGKGVDIIYDPVGGDYSEQAFRSIAWKGKHLIVGFANGYIPRIPLNLPLLKGAEITGVFWGAFTQKEPQKSVQNISELVAWYFDGKLKPHIDATYSLSETPKALEAIMNRRVKGKIVIDMEKPSSQ